MLILQGISYSHPNGDMLFNDLNLSINKHDKIALTGNNGTGKSTLLKIMAGDIQPSAGRVVTSATPYYVPQLFDRYNDLTVAEALGIDGKLKALQNILDGNVTDEYMALLGDDWDIEERCREAFARWDIAAIDTEQKIGSLSGGQKVKVFLAGTGIHQPGIVLLDEPGNHLDTCSRSILYNYIRQATCTMVVVSHDRTLLNIPGTVWELGRSGIKVYGGDYDFYAAQKVVEREALEQEVKNGAKALRKAKETEREAMERQHKLDARGKKKQEQAGVPTIAMNTLRNSAEKSTSRMKDIHKEKVSALASDLDELRKALPDTDTMKINFASSALHNGKILVTGSNVNFGFGNIPLWQHPLDFQVRSGERIAIAGANGSGKTTLVKMILGQLQPQTGSMERAIDTSLYVDQDYSLINGALTVYEQAQQFNSGALQEHEIKTRLNRFLFTKAHWDKPCSGLSGGEKMRLVLCSLTINAKPPDMIVLDEPTNNLDIRNVEILTNAVNEYEGALIVISHDLHFLNQIEIGRTIALNV